MVFMGGGTIMLHMGCSLRRRRKDLKTRRQTCGFCVERTVCSEARGGQGVEMGANQNRLMSEQRTQGVQG